MRSLAVYLFGMLFAACAASPRHDSTWRIVTELPLDVSAALLAEAVAGVVPTADPEPHRPGAPIRCADGEYRVELAVLEGRPLLVGNRRLKICPPTAGNDGGAVRALAVKLASGVPVVASVRLRAVGPGVEITADFPPELAQRAEHACREAIATASDPSRDGGGGLPPNLSAWLAATLSTRARTSDPVAAAAMLRNAVSLGADDAVLHLQLAEYERSIGRATGARRSEMLAILATADPRRRAAAARSCQGELDAAGLQALATQAGNQGDARTAAALLHSARRLLGPMESLDTTIADTDPEIARAERLLARERRADRAFREPSLALRVAAPAR